MRRTIVLVGGFATVLAAGRVEAQGGWTAASPKVPAKSSGVRTATMAPAPRPTPVQPLVIPNTGFPTFNTAGIPAVSTTGISGIPVANTTGFHIPNATGMHTNFVAPSIAQITYFPTVVLTDGRVLANFGTGRGYEQVLRRCPTFLPAGATVAPCWAVDVYGNYKVLQQR